jgi:hypothetical protein
VAPPLATAAAVSRRRSIRREQRRPVERVRSRVTGLRSTQAFVRRSTLGAFSVGGARYSASPMHRALQSGYPTIAAIRASPETDAMAMCGRVAGRPAKDRRWKSVAVKE